MSAEWFDLAQRLYAQRTGRAVPRLMHAPFVLDPAHTVAVRATVRGGGTQVCVARRGGVEQVGTDADGLALLARSGGSITASTATALLTDSAGTVAALDGLGRKFAGSDDYDVAGAAAMCGYWAERAAHPGTGAVVDVLAASRARFLLGTEPAQEREASSWRSWLKLPAVSDCSALFAWADVVGAGEVLTMTEPVREEDRYRFERWQESVSDGADWTRPDGLAGAAIGLRSRCDAAELWDAALLGDPLWRRRAVFTGHVVTGTAKVIARQGHMRTSVSVYSDRMDVRLRVGEKVCGWTGSVMAFPFARFSGEVRATRVVAGRLVLDIGGAGAFVPCDGAQVCVLPEPPSPHAMRSRRSMYWRLYGQRSWLSSGHRATVQRRDVPLDVLVAGAED